MTTVQTIINDAAIDLGVLVAGMSLASDDEAWVLRKLNYMLNSFSKEGLIFNVKVRDNALSLVSGQSVYTIGTGGDFNTARPNMITKAFIRVNDTDYPVKIRPMDEYDSLIDKSARTGRPLKLFYSPEYSKGDIYLYPKPDDTYSLYLISEKPFTTYSSVGTTVELPGEYDELFMTNLAVRIASRWGKSPSQITYRTAKDTHNDIKSNNFCDNIKAIEYQDGDGGYDIDGDI